MSLSSSSSAELGSPWSPFRRPVFAVIWTATVVSNVGSWMYSAASGWLMTSLNPDPFIVSLVQVATTLPMFLVAIPAGALADILDIRRFLIVTEAAYTFMSFIFATIVWLGAVTPANLLLFIFLTGVAGALTAPAWQSVVPQLVPRQDLSQAVAANGVGINVSRAVGPALGGVMVAKIGIAAPFWFNAISNLGVIGALLWWHPPQRRTRHLPVERFYSAIRTGFRHARHNGHLRATLLRAVSFFLFASAYWALLPLVTRSQIAAGPELYGYLLGAIGAAAVATALGLPWLKAKLGPDRQVAAGTLHWRWCCSGSLASRQRHSRQASSPERPGSRCYRASTFLLRSRSPIGCEAAGSRSS
jgi:MFS family permease